MADNRKMRANLDEGKTSAIKNTFLSIKATIDIEQRNVSVRIIQVLPETDIRQMVADVRWLIISWDKKKSWIGARPEMIKKGNSLRWETKHW